MGEGAHIAMHAQSAPWDLRRLVLSSQSEKWHLAQNWRT